MTTVDIGYLIPELRLTIGDITPATYRYTNEWLRVAILASIKKLARWWNYRYILDSDNLVYRNTTLTFSEAEPPIIMMGDDRPIVIGAALIILEGSLENNAWDLVSWRDAEVAFSNLESGRIRDSNIKRLWEELRELVTPPSKRLASPIKNSLPGFHLNTFETMREY